LNLLVKHHWVPFAPAQPFHYNVHVGIDVGGRHNNRIMACAGYGFAAPERGLVYLPRQIEIDLQQAEPIPTAYLLQGLRELLDELRQHIVDCGQSPNFSRVLFMRDGELRGDGEQWNELDALVRLHRHYADSALIDQQSVWTAAEISKRAARWRVIRHNGTFAMNPIVGTAAFPFEDRRQAIVCTSGSPYLTQGTASPLLVRTRDISGQAHAAEVVKDIVWEADMCFTKVDMGMSLPWTLHVADTGALQQSRHYAISGVTV
jgi:hypothetical protein